jgi:hypothetical protein
MKYTKLGKTGIRVSKICLGTMNFGDAYALSNPQRVEKKGESRLRRTVMVSQDRSLLKPRLKKPFLISSESLKIKFGLRSELVLS